LFGILLCAWCEFILSRLFLNKISKKKKKKKRKRPFGVRSFASRSELSEREIGAGLGRRAGCELETGHWESFLRS